MTTRQTDRKGEERIIERKSAQQYNETKFRIKLTKV